MGKYGKKNEVSLNPLDYNITLLGESGLGKEQPVSEPVLTIDGWKPMGDIMVGDVVYGRNGDKHRVIGVYPQGIKDVYKVSFRDGTSTRCGLDHLWTVTTKKQRENCRKYGDERFTVLTLREIMRDYKKEFADEIGNYKYKYSVPINKAVEFYSNDDLEIDPYILGLLIGDGGFTGSVCTFTNSEKEILDCVYKYFVECGMNPKVRDYENHKQIVLTDGDICGDGGNKLKLVLSCLGLLKCSSREKFIPKRYMFSSIKSRAALLSGLINTDGSVQKKALNYSTYSKKLAYDVAELARSLGFICTVREYDRTNDTSTKKYESEIEYRVRIISDDYSLLSLTKKHANKLGEKNLSYVKSITNIECVGKEECQCIMVDNPEQLYITKDYIVTHNTTISKEICEKLVGDEGYIHFDIGNECGAGAIQGIVTEKIEDYAKLKEVTDDIIENKFEDYKKLKVIIWDTLDELIPILEAESIKQYNRKNPDKKTDTINGAHGGFGKGQEFAMNLFINLLTSLKNVGISSIIIGHLKRTDIIDPITQETFSKLTADTTQKYFNAIKNKQHFCAVGYIDRDIVKEKTGRKNVATRQDITISKAITESRVISFRDDTYSVDSKSRFADIVDKIPFDSDEFIKAMKDAIIAEHNKGNKTLEQSKKEQAEEAKVAEKAAAEYSKSVKQNKIDVDRNEELKATIQSNFTSLDKEKKTEFKTLMNEVGVESFKDVSEIPTKSLEKLAKFFN